MTRSRRGTKKERGECANRMMKKTTRAYQSRTQYLRKSLRKKEKAPKVRAKSQSTHARRPRPRSSISGNPFDNTGPGNMTNNNVGNIYISTISGVGSDARRNTGVSKSYWLSFVMCRPRALSTDRLESAEV